MAVELPEAARELLEKRAFGHVVTINRDGTPHVTLVWLDVDHAGLSFNTAAGRVKERNLTRDPRVIVSVQDPDRPGMYAAFHGRAQPVTEGAEEQIHRLARKYLDEPEYPWLQPGEQRVTMRVIVERITGMGPWSE